MQMQDFKHTRKILTKQDNSLKHIGTLEQIHKSGIHDFYFQPSFRFVDARGKQIEHLSLHNSGQSHLKFSDSSKDIQHSKSNAMAFDDIGCAGFFYMEYEVSQLPMIVSSAPSDLIIDWPEDRVYMWIESNFVSSEFLLGNNLGFGGVVHDGDLKFSYIGKKVIAIGAIEKTQNTVLMFHYGFKEKLEMPSKIKFMPIKGQFPKNHRFIQS